MCGRNKIYSRCSTNNNYTCQSKQNVNNDELMMISRRYSTGLSESSQMPNTMFITSTCFLKNGLLDVKNVFFPDFMFEL